MVEVETDLSLYTVELGNPVGAPMLFLTRRLGANRQ